MGWMHKPECYTAQCPRGTRQRLRSPRHTLAARFVPAGRHAMRILRDPSGTTVESPLRRGGHLLVLDSDESLVRTLGAILRHDGYDVLTAVSLYDAMVGLRDQSIDMILAELRADDTDGEDMLARARALVPGAVVVVLTRYATFESALR